MSQPNTKNPAELLRLEGKCALVTGGGGGIGSAVVRILHAAGAAVASLDLPGREGPAESLSVPADISDAAAVRKAVASVHDRHGRIDIVVHCAGITRDSVLWKLDDEAWSRVIAVNLDSAFHLLKACAPLMRENRGGSVVLMSSINGERGKFGQANYAASKGGLIALGKTAACELGRFGIRVNCISPGLIRTAMTESLPEKFRREAIDESLLGRAGEPEDVAGAVLFLCSDLSRHITGQVLRVDGGQLTA